MPVFNIVRYGITTLQKAYLLVTHIT